LYELAVPLGIVVDDFSVYEGLYMSHTTYSAFCN